MAELTRYTIPESRFSTGIYYRADEADKRIAELEKEIANSATPSDELSKHWTLPLYIAACDDTHPDGWYYIEDKELQEIGGSYPLPVANAICDAVNAYWREGPPDSDMIKRYTTDVITAHPIPTPHEDGEWVRYEDHLAACKGDANWIKAQSDEIEGLKECAKMNYERIAELEAQLREKHTSDIAAGWSEADAHYGHKIAELEATCDVLAADYGTERVRGDALFNEAKRLQAQLSRAHAALRDAPQYSDGDIRESIARGATMDELFDLVVVDNGYWRECHAQAIKEANQDG